MAESAGLRFLGKRAASVILVTAASSLMLFAVIHLLPGDAALTMLADTPHTQAMREALRQELGIDDPWPTQYARWLGGLFSGSSSSLVTGEPIRTIVGGQLPVTLLLSVYGTVVGIVFGLALGLVSARRKGLPADVIIRVFTIGGVSIPAVWSSLLVLLLLLRAFGWSPPIIYIGPFDVPREHFALMVWPALLIAWELGSHLAWVTRASVDQAMSREYVTAARARGVREGRIVLRYGLRNAVLPPLTTVGLHIGTLLGGTIVLETVFGLPGLGLGIVDAALARDLPLILTQASIIVVLHQLLNLCIDSLYLVLDPRASDAA